MTENKPIRKSIQIPDELHHRLDVYATVNRKTMKEATREIIEGFLNKVDQNG